MFEANDTQVGGNHYSKAGKNEQHWDRVARLDLDYFQAQITKYVERCWDKNGIEDLQKAHHFIEKYIELAKARGWVGKQQAARQLTITQLEEEIAGLRQRLVNLEATTERQHVEDLEHKLVYLLDNEVVNEDGMIRFPDGEVVPCLKGHGNNPALDFTMEGAYGDGRTMWRCVNCRKIVYTAGRQRPHAAHPHCEDTTLLVDGADPQPHGYVNQDGDTAVISPAHAAALADPRN